MINVGDIVKIINKKHEDFGYTGKVVENDEDDWKPYKVRFSSSDYRWFNAKELSVTTPTFLKVGDEVQIVAKVTIVEVDEEDFFETYRVEVGTDCGIEFWIAPSAIVKV